MATPLIEADKPHTTRPAIMAAPGGAASIPHISAVAQIYSVQTSEITGKSETVGSTFVNLDTLGLRPSERKRDSLSALKESDPNPKK